MPLDNPRTTEWGDQGEDYDPTDASYAPQQRPLAGPDNRFNYNASVDIIRLFNYIRNELPGELQPGGELGLDDHYVQDGDIYPLNLNGQDLENNGTVVYDASNEYIRQSRLQNDDIEINAGSNLGGGGVVSLGNALSLALDITSDVDFSGNEAHDFALETRTDRPSGTTPGRIIYREDRE